METGGTPVLRDMPPPTPNTEMQRQQLLDLVALANAKGIPGAPFSCLNTAGAGQFFDWKPPYVWVDRGVFNPLEIYNAGDLVHFGGPSGAQFSFVCVINGVNANGNVQQPLNQDGNGNEAGNMNGLPWQEVWYSVYQRIRVSVGTVGPASLSTFQQSVSGPWPITVPDINFPQLAFYYPDTGNQESVTVQGITEPSFGNPGAFGFGPVAMAFADADCMFQVNPEPSFALLKNPQIIVLDTQDPSTGLGSVTFEAITNVDPADGNSQFRIRYVSSSTFTIEVGGSQPVPIDIIFSCTAAIRRGLTVQEIANAPVLTVPPNGFDNGLDTNFIDADTDPASVVKIDTSGWIPGTGFAAAFSGWKPVSFTNIIGGQPPSSEPQEGVVSYTCHVNQMVAPGTYSVTFSTASSPNNRASGQATETNYVTLDPNQTPTYHSLWRGEMDWSTDTFASMPTSMLVEGNSTFIFNQSAEVPGVHNSKRVLKIQVTAAGEFAPPGVTIESGVFETDISGTPVGQRPGTIAPQNGGPVDVARDATPVQPGLQSISYASILSWTITPSTLGYWFAQAPPISSLGILPYERMPWNQFPVDKFGKALTNTYLNSILPYTGGGRTGLPAALAYQSDSPVSQSSSSDGVAWCSNETPIMIILDGGDAVLSTGDSVTISGIHSITAANGVWNVTKIDDKTFTLNGSAGNLPPLFVAPPIPIGLLVPGNIDINNRPLVPNGPDISTVDSITVDDGGMAVLIPLVNATNRAIMTIPAAIAWYQQTGQHLGKFDTNAHAETYANQLHLQQDEIYSQDAVLIYLQFTQSGIGILGTATELLSWPQLWMANVFFPAGWVIVDSNGNIQTSTAPGRSGPNEPIWEYETGQVTADTVNGNSEPIVAWRLTKKLRPTPNRKQNTPYPVGSTVIDFNGNTQKSVSAWQPNTNYPANATLIDKNGNLQSTTAGGVSGANVPAWNLALNGTTADGTITWKTTMLGVVPTSDANKDVSQINWSLALNGLTKDGTVMWQLAAITPRLGPAVGRISPPIYPNFWQNGPAGRNQPPPLTMPYLQVGLDGRSRPAWNFLFTAASPDDVTIATPTVAGPNVWIYRVALNRMPQAPSTAKPPTAPIAVTIGVMRNGVFTPFGTFQTGTIFTAIWPVFTMATALAYQASEAIDVQAEMITCGQNYQSWGLATYPLAAAHITDLTAILNLLN